MRMSDWSSGVGSSDLEPLPTCRPQLRIKRKTIVFLGNFQSFFERAVVEAKNNVRIHLNEAAIAVPGKTLVARCGSKALNRLIVKAKIKDTVYHARHGHTRAGTHGYTQRVGSLYETLASDTLAMRDAVLAFLDRNIAEKGKRVPVRIVLGGR